MAGSTGPIVAAGMITMGNTVLGNGQPWTAIIPTAVATAIAGAMLGLMEKASPQLAIGIAWIALVTSLLITPKSGKSAVTNLLSITGMGAKK